MTDPTHHTVTLTDDHCSVHCPNGGYGDCGLRQLDGPDMPDGINRFGLIAIDSIHYDAYLGPPDMLLLPPAEDDGYDDCLWHDVYTDLGCTVDVDEWYPQTGDCAVAEWIGSGNADLSLELGTYAIAWAFEGDLDDWSLDLSFTESEPA